MKPRLFVLLFAAAVLVAVATFTVYLGATTNGPTRVGQIEGEQPSAEEELAPVPTLTREPPPSPASPTPTPELAPIATPGLTLCQLPLPTAGCEITVTNVQPERLNLRESPGTDQQVIAKLSEGDIVCLLGSPALADGFQWWPVRTAEGQDGWAAAFNPDEPDKPWLTPTGRTCPSNSPLQAVIEYVATTGFDGETFEFTDPVECRQVPEEEIEIHVGKFCLLNADIGPTGATIVVGAFQSDFIWELTLELQDNTWVVTNVEYVGL
ncbi:MAG: SH3 domain-containing protein [Dehalococcoidia bacterium]